MPALANAIAIRHAIALSHHAGSVPWRLGRLQGTEETL